MPRPLLFSGCLRTGRQISRLNPVPEARRTKLLSHQKSINNNNVKGSRFLNRRLRLELFILPTVYLILNRLL